jgi:protein-L-isoaspartate(D-aspartate) O-methyltransferase
VEIVPELHQQAKSLLARHGIDNITLEQGDAANGWDAHQPYDAIAVTGSLPSLPQGLKDNLQIGGRLFAVVGEAPVMEAVLVTRINANEWCEETLFETAVPPLLNAQKVQHFTF